MKRSTEPREIILCAYNLLKNPTRWSQGLLAQDASMTPVDPRDPRAIKFCWSGALGHCSEQATIKEVEDEVFDNPEPYWTKAERSLTDYLNLNADKLGIDRRSYLSIVVVNDRDGYDMVMKVMRAYLGIADTEAEQPPTTSPADST